jgi:HSP20 family protein
MNNRPARPHPRSWLPNLLSYLRTRVPSLAGLRRNHLIRFEEEIEDGRYVLRAELPGIDPEKDVDITVRDGRLTIKAERTERKETKGRSEFSYGSFVRSITLPAGTDEEEIKATYNKGILTVSVGVAEQAAAAEKHIKVQAAS